MHNPLLTKDISRLSSLFPELTEKQFTCLFMYCMGKGSKEIGEHMEIRDKTVRNYLQDLKEIFSLDRASDLRAIFLVRMLAPVEYHT